MLQLAVKSWPLWSAVTCDLFVIGGWRSNNSADLGFGAEDIAAVEPLLVIKNEQGQVEGVKYDRITAVLVNAIKEQQQQINALKKLVCSQNRRAAACKE